MSTITELISRQVCDMCHGEETHPALSECLRCGRDLCPLHYCDLSVPDTSKKLSWASTSIATFCRPCAAAVVEWIGAYKEDAS